MAIALDTHQFFNRLKGVGFSEQQAELIAQLHTETVAVTLDQARHDYELDNLVTKRDLKEMDTALQVRMKEMETGLQTKMREMETGLQLKMAETKADLQRWMVTLVLGVGILQTSIVAALIMRMAGKF